jgi:hypothetical protein
MTRLLIELWRKDPATGEHSLTTFRCQSERVIYPPAQEHLRQTLVEQFGDVIHSRIV